MDDMAVTGKIAFGIPFGTREADPKEAMETAIAGFQDGLYRIFINDTEAEQLDTFLELKEHDTITIIRLVMLTGGFF